MDAASNTFIISAISIALALTGLLVAIATRSPRTGIRVADFFFLISVFSFAAFTAISAGAYYAGKMVRARISGVHSGTLDPATGAVAIDHELRHWLAYTVADAIDPLINGMTIGAICSVVAAVICFAGRRLASMVIEDQAADITEKQAESEQENANTSAPKGESVSR